MKLSIWLMAILLVASPAFAQDDGDGGLGFGGDPFGDSSDDFFHSDGFANSLPAAPKVDPVAEIRAMLAAANAPPLDKAQEKPLKKLYQQERKALSKSFEKRFRVSLDSAMAAQNRGRGQRSPSQGGLAAEARRVLEELNDKVVASLTIDQQRFLRTHQSEQARIIRLDQLTRNMARAGVVLTDEQRLEVEALFTRESRLRTLIIVEAKGKPYQSTLANLEAQTARRVAGVLDQPQKALLAEVMTQAQSRPRSRNSFQGIR